MRRLIEGDCPGREAVKRAASAPQRETLIIERQAFIPMPGPHITPPLGHSTDTLANVDVYAMGLRELAERFAEEGIYPPGVNDRHLPTK